MYSGKLTTEQICRPKDMAKQFQRFGVAFRRLLIETGKRAVAQTDHRARAFEVRLEECPNIHSTTA